HGLLGFNEIVGGLLKYWKEIPAALRGAGAVFYVATVPATSDIKTRATSLAQQIAFQFPGQSVHLIGHSMGGLDCRYLITHLIRQYNLNFNVLSLTTFATPHRGSPVADLVVNPGITNLMTFRLLINMLPCGQGDCSAWNALTTWNMRQFNIDTPDVPGVRYYSYAGSFSPGLADQILWGIAHPLMYATEGENDGVVSVTSAKWGEYLGKVDGVTHTEIIGMKLSFTRPSDVIGFFTAQIPYNPERFFVQHASKLARDAETW
ncbi:alpha/beta-hydrolase, partial [Ceratobasidium sp. AG-I]